MKEGGPLTLSVYLWRVQSILLIMDTYFLEKDAPKQPILSKNLPFKIWNEVLF